MYNRREGIVSTLHQLIQTCRNCERAFATAVDGVTDGGLRELFNAYATQRSHFAAELESELSRLSEDGPANASRSQALRRPWVRVRSAVGNEDEGGLLAECGQGEHATLESYREALAAQLPESLYALVRRQYVEVQDARDRLLSLERRFAGGYEYEPSQASRAWQPWTNEQL